ncbi:MAG: hypothetical protein IKZ61_11905 [Prevotella sp.]|nr:hypothetical protein [Prevotella sp.]
MGAKSYTRRELMGGLIQELEYLEIPNGSVCFASDYIPNGQDNVIQCKFKFDGYINESGSIYHSWYWARPSGGDGYPNYRIMSAGAVGYITVQNGRRGNYVSQNRVPVTKGSIYEFYIYKNQYFTINGTRYTYTNSNPTGTNDCALYIIDTNRRFKGRFYYLKWWKGDTLVLDWVPAIVNGEICIYDRLNKKKLTRSGAGRVMPGPVKRTFII